MRQRKSILFMGLGGAGQRHLRYLQRAFPKARFGCFRSRRTTPLLNPDFSVKQGGFVEDEYSLRVFPDFDSALSENPDLVVISTPTSFHANQICRALDADCDVFCEKPGLICRYDFKRIEDSLSKSKGNLHIGFQRFYHPVSVMFREFVGNKRNGEISSIECNVFSFFPDWHKYEDYRTLYAGKKSLGGGVIRTECHELALLMSVLGRFEHLEIKQFRNKNFEIDVESQAVLTGILQGIPTTLNLDFLSPDSLRAITIETGTEKRLFDFNGNQILASKNQKDFVQTTNFEEVDQFQVQLNEVLIKGNFDNAKTVQLLENLSQVFESSSLAAVTDAA